MFQVTTDDVAQLAHVGWGGFMVFIGLCLHFPLWFAVLLAVMVSFGKEASESIWGGWEPVQPWASGMRDFAFFVVGIATAVLFLYLASVIHAPDTYIF